MQTKNTKEQQRAFTFFRFNILLTIRKGSSWEHLSLRRQFSRFFSGGQR